MSLNFHEEIATQINKKRPLDVIEDWTPNKRFLAVVQGGNFRYDLVDKKKLDEVIAQYLNELQNWKPLPCDDSFPCPHIEDYMSKKSERKNLAFANKLLRRIYFSYIPKGNCTTREEIKEIIKLRDEKTIVHSIQSRGDVSRLEIYKHIEAEQHDVPRFQHEKLVQLALNVMLYRSSLINAFKTLDENKLGFAIGCYEMHDWGVLEIYYEKWLKAMQELKEIYDFISGHKAAKTGARFFYPAFTRRY